ncbi:dynein heavy chain domain-containing protein 1 isoform X3 [Hyperolius riggenbachi]|uniref:dynein heavy chain domain-containing protein 1 isoform X3 n=1 Tax=Hyperolius riggenbachi TaxID=752182 RepID=UPI0035A2C0FF
MEEPTRTPGPLLPPLPQYITQPQPGGCHPVRPPASIHTHGRTFSLGERLCHHLSELTSAGHVSSENVSQLSKEVVRFFSLSSQGLDRKWWLQLVDVLKLLQPFQECLSDERKNLLPALEEVHRKYERHRSSLRDLDILGALRGAFPLDHSKLFRLPKNLEELYQPKTQAIQLRDFPQHLANVGIDLAGMESVWRYSRCGTSLALLTNLPVEFIPDPQPQPYRWVPTPPSAPPPGQRAERERCTGGVSGDISGFEAAELLVQYRHMGKVVFLYLTRLDGVHDCHYDLRVVPLPHLQPEHYVFSPFGILHVDPQTGTETLDLGVWHREAVVCRALRTIPFFRDFLMRKAMRWWRMNVRRIGFLTTREIIDRSLVQTVPHYTAALQHVQRLLLELAEVPWLPITSSCPQTIQQIEEIVSDVRREAQKRLHHFLTLVAKILELVREDTYALLKTTQTDARSALSKLSSQKTCRRRQQQVESWLHRLGNFASLVGHVICQNLHRIIRGNLLSFVQNVIQCPAEPGEAFLQLSLEFGEAGELTLSPSDHHIQQSFNRLLDSVLENVLQVTEQLIQKRALSSGAGFTDHAEDSDVTGALPLNVDQIRTVIRSSAPPAGAINEVQNNEELRVEGNLQRYHYLPLNLHSLPHLIHTDPSIHQATEVLQRLLEESLDEVRTFCVEHCWVLEIWRFIQSWSPQILEQLRGKSAREYEDIILRLQGWEERVRSVRDHITTPVLTVSCVAIRAWTGPRLISTIQIILVQLTAEVAERSHALIQELHQVLLILQGVTTDIPNFSKCAGKVAEYTDRRQELQERVEYVHSLYELIRMNFHQPTSKEQQVHNQLVETWDLFLHHLKLCAEFLSGHLSTMADSLDQSFLVCYRKAEDIVTAASSARFLDPDQSTEVTTTELETLLKSLRTVLTQLRDLSHSRHILQGQTFDISGILRGEQSIQARQDSWKLLNRCREQISAWKHRPFVKVNIEQVREKICRWERSLQDVGKLLLEEDPIIESVKVILRDFTQHLPLLHSLLSPALSTGHWGAIFTVMGRMFPGLESLTLLDLLSCPISQHQEQIQKIILQAQAEFSMTMNLKTTQTFWKEKQLQLVRCLICVPTQDPSPDYSKRPPSGRFRQLQHGVCTQDSGTYLLTDKSSLCGLLDDSLLSLQTMRGSPFSSDIRDEISIWIQMLQELALLLDLWISFQQRWVFLIKVQSELETPLPSPEMLAQFQPIDEAHRAFLEVTLQDPLILSTLKPTKQRERHFYGESLCSALRTGVGIMDNIIANMADVLYSYRCSFPRLFFLSDQDLLGLLAASPEPSERLPCALLCFPQLTDVNFQAQTPNYSAFPLYSSQALTVGVMGTFQERITFITPIQWNPKTISWLTELEERLQDSVRGQLELCLAEFREENYGDTRGLIERGLTYPWQCLAVTEEVLWCEDMEKILLTDQKWSLRDQHKVKIQLLTDRLRGQTQDGSPAASRKEQTILSAWITLATKHRDRELSLLDIRTLDCFSWSRILKYRASLSDSAENLKGENGDGAEMSNAEAHSVSSPLFCYVEVLGYHLPYRYEYVGLDKTITDTPLTDRTALGLILALHHFQCGAVIGQDEVYRTQTLMALGSSFGHQVEVLNCWGGLTLKRLTLHLLGALQGGAWLVLSGAHKLKSSVQASLGELLLDIQSSCQSMMKERQNKHSQRQAKVLSSIQLDGRLVPVHRDYGCFMTFPNVNLSSPLAHNLRLLLRPVSLRAPDLRFTAELALLAAGFQSHSQLAGKIAHFLQLAQECGTVTAANAPILLKTVIRRTISIMHKNISCSKNEKGVEHEGHQGILEKVDNFHEDPPLMSSRLSILQTSLQEENSMMIALSTSSIWSSLPASEYGHLQNLLKAIFPMYVSPVLTANSSSALWSAITQDLQESGLEVHSEFRNTIMQLFQALQQSSGVLLTGPAGGGKTTCWKVLNRALNNLAENMSPLELNKALNSSSCDKHQLVHIVHLFPNSVSPAEFLGGGTDEAHAGGMFSSIFQRTQRGSLAQKWVILDGSAAPEWIEPISCLFSPLPIMTLANGHRLCLNDSTKLIFEMTDSSALSPAVSTLCSFVHCGGQETWRAMLKVFMSSLYVRYRISWSTQHLLQSFSEALIPRTLVFLEKLCASALDPHSAQTTQIASGVKEVSSFCAILQALMDQHLLRESVQTTSDPPKPSQETAEHTKANEGFQDNSPPSGNSDGGLQTMSSVVPHQDFSDGNKQRAHIYFIYAFIWGFGGYLHPRHRLEFEAFFVEALSHSGVGDEVPEGVSMYEVTPSADGQSLMPYSGGLSPQVGASMYAAQSLLLSGYPVLLVGSPGSGKTTLAQSLLPSGSSSVRIPFHSLLQADHLRRLLGNRHEAPPSIGLRRSRLLPLRHVVFLDDLHEAAVDPEGPSCPSLEVIRHFMSDPPSAPSSIFLATACSPEFGSGLLSPRLSRLFSVLVLAPFGSEMLLSFFTTRFTSWMKKSIPAQQPKEFGEALALVSINLFQKVIQTLPAKYHFTLHHLHRVLHSMTCLCPLPGTHLSALPHPSAPPSIVTRCGVVSLWMHEILRTFSDCLQTQVERDTFRDELRNYALQTFCSQKVQETEDNMELPTEPPPITPAEIPPSTSETRDGQDVHEITFTEKERTQEDQPITDEIRETSPIPFSSTPSSQHMEGFLPPNLIPNDQQTEELNFCHEHFPGTMERVDSLTYKERPMNTFGFVQNLTLSPSDCQHLTRLIRVLSLPRGHIILLSQHPGTGRRSLATLAAKTTQCAFQELSGKETKEKCLAVVREACWKAGVQGTATALLVGASVPQSTLTELQTLIRDGTFPGLYSEEQEQKVLQTMLPIEKSRNRATNCRALQDRFTLQVRDNLHVIFIWRGVRPPSPLCRYTYTDIYVPWDFSSLQHVAEKLLQEMPGSSTWAVPLHTVVSLVHLSAQSYHQRMWPELPLTSPKAFMTFITTFRRVFSHRNRSIVREMERFQSAVSRVEEVYAEYNRWTQEVELLSQRLDVAEQEAERWRRDLLEVQAAERQVTVECQELERAKQRVGGHVSTLQGQIQQQLEEACVQWWEVQKQLKISDVDEIRSYRSPPALVIMVTDVLCAVYGRDGGWESAKLLLGQENIYQDLQLYDARGMSDSVFSSLTRAVSRAEFSVAAIRPASVAAASLCDWLCGLQRYCSLLRQLEKRKALLSQAEAQDLEAAQRMAEKRLQQERLSTLAHQYSLNLHNAQEKEEELRSQREQCQEKKRLAQECGDRVTPHKAGWTAVLEALQKQMQSVLAESLLAGAAVSYLGALPWPLCMALLEKWQRLCDGEEVALDPDDGRDILGPHDSRQKVVSHLVEVLKVPTDRMDGNRRRLPKNIETQMRAGLLRTCAQHSHSPILLLDPDHVAEKWLPALLRGGTSEGPGDGFPELCIIEAADPMINQRLRSDARGGSLLLLTNVQRNLSIIESVRTSLYQTTDPTPEELTRPHPGGTPIRSNHKASRTIILSTSLPLQQLVAETGPAFIKDVIVMDLSLGPTALQEELTHQILLARDPRLQEEGRSLCDNYIQLTSGIRQSQDTLLDYVTCATTPLLQRLDFLHQVSTCEELQTSLQESLRDVEALQQQVEDNMVQYVLAAEHGCLLFSRLQEISSLSPQYHFPAVSVLRWARQALSTGMEVGVKTEKALIRGILSHVLPALTEDHRQVLRVLMAVGQPPDLEWFSFLGIMRRSAAEVTSSLIQRPHWLSSEAWEELGQLEKMSCFQGIRSSLSTQAQQWQEYFSLRSTVIGPIPCSSFSHLTLFQTAILWRILKPGSLGLVLTHLTSCMLGPAECEEPDLEALSSPHAPLLFLIPTWTPLLYHSRAYIQHEAHKAGREVKVLTLLEFLPVERLTDILLGCQQDGVWLLINWHPKLGPVLEAAAAGQAQISPEFRLCIIVEEETLSTVYGHIRRISREAPVLLRPPVCDLLQESCRVIVQELGERLRDPRMQRLLILHNILILRQDYSDFMQSSLYAWGVAELEMMLRCAERVGPADWMDTMVYLTGDIIYGGHMTDDGDTQTVMDVTQQCLQNLPHDQFSRRLSNFLSSLVRGRETGSVTNSMLRLLQKLSSQRSPAVLGLSEGLHSAVMEACGHKVLMGLLTSQDTWTKEVNHPTSHTQQIDGLARNVGDRFRRCSSGSSYSPPSGAISGENPLSLCLSLLTELDELISVKQREIDNLYIRQREMDSLDTKCGLQEEEECSHDQQRDSTDTAQNMEEESINTERAKGRWSSEKKEKTFSMHGQSWRPQPILGFLLEEWDLLSGLIHKVTEEVKAAESLCQCSRCEAIRRALSQGCVPTWWNVYSSDSPNRTLMAWNSGLQSRMKHFSTYIIDPSPHNVTYNLSAFQHPSRLLQCVLMEQALKDLRELNAYSLHIQVLDRRAPQVDGAGIALCGVYLQNALWDTRLGTLQETLSPKLCALPLVQVTAVQDRERGMSPSTCGPYYLCPVYPHQAPEGQSQHQQSPILYIPLPSSISPSVWRLRRVHALCLL